MASFNSSLFLSILVVISAFMTAPSSVEAQNPLQNSILSFSGIVRCVTNITLSPNGAIPANIPSFPNAEVDLLCGNRRVANARTNDGGAFKNVGAGIDNFFGVGGFSECMVVVDTPLSECNPTLPSTGKLTANVARVLSTIVNGVNRIDLEISQLFLLRDM